MQHFVENLLKVLKLLKTRKRARNEFSRIPLRSIRQGAKAPFKTKEQNRLLIYQLKFQKNLTFFKNMIKYNHRKEGTQNDTQGFIHWKKSTKWQCILQKRSEHHVISIQQRR